MPPTPSGSRHDQDLEKQMSDHELSKLLPGEDRSFGHGLFVDLIPRSCWFTNARTCIDARDWERVRQMVLQRADRTCEACKDSSNPRLEVHERWKFIARTHVQTLRRLILLCARCHEATHFGRASIIGRGEEAMAHLRRVTGMTKSQATAHLERAFARWTERSDQSWELDLSMLAKAGIRVTTPTATKRASVHKTLR